MNRAVRTCSLALLIMVLATPAATAADAPAADRESTYPPQVANVTHAPWQPGATQDVQVTARLAEHAAMPDQVSLLYCRVEPSYTCGLPVLMEPVDDGRSYAATVVWDDRFMRAETVHMGYNVTLRYDDPENGSIRASDRISAPTENHWLPGTFPADSDGIYYFYRIGPGPGTGEAPAAPLAACLLVLVALCALVGRGRHR